MTIKTFQIWLFSLFSFLLVSLSVYLGFNSFFLDNAWLGLGLGLGLMLIAIPFHLLGRHFPNLYIFSFIINSVGIGLSLTSYYVFKQYSLDWVDFIIAITVSFGLLFVFSWIKTTLLFSSHPRLFTFFIILVSFSTSLSLWLNVPTFSGLSFYYLNITYFFMVGLLIISPQKKDLSRIMSLVSFGAFIVVSIIVFIIITEGEALQSLEGLEIDIPSRSRRNKTS